MRTSTVLAALAAAGRATATMTVEFFYTDTLNTCQINGVYLDANLETEHGGICAWVPETQRIYACPAPDPTCWTFEQSCINGGSETQITCNESGATWCCYAGETCTTLKGQINVCVSNFSSPNAGVPVAQANATELEVLGVSSITATTQTVDPTPYSTRTISATGTSTSTSSSSSSSSSGSSSSSTSSSTTSSSSTSSPSVITPSDHSSTGVGSKSSLSGGAIAGIVVGIVAVLALLGVAFCLLARRRRARSPDALLANNEMNEPYRDTAYNRTTHPEKHRYGGPNGLNEVGDNQVRHEMQGIGPGGMGELDGSQGGTGGVRHELA